MDSMRKQLDVLMGANRNGDSTEVTRNYYDRDVCRLFLAGLCPHELFQLTKMDKGPCPKLHSLQLRKDGDYELILDGIHENMLQLGYVDPMMQKTVKCLDNLLVSDITHRFIMRTQQMNLQVYLPPIAISIHALIAQHVKKKIEWPKSFYRYRTSLAERVDMFQTWKNRITPYISRHLSMKSFAEDSITQMLHILSPRTLRPVAFHLLYEKEKSRMGQLVNFMVSYAMKYIFEKENVERVKLVS